MGGSNERQYFSDKNGKLCDAVRDKIDDWKSNKKITEDEYYFLLCSLLESVDRVANTASVYGAFLKTLKKSAQKPLQIKPAELILNEMSTKFLMMMPIKLLVKIKLMFYIWIHHITNDNMQQTITYWKR